MEIILTPIVHFINLKPDCMSSQKAMLIRIKQS